jgi:ankyrin repeat protein
VSLSNYVDKLSLIFMDTGRSAPRYQAMALLYPRSTKLQSYLFEYFIVVVSFCRYLFKFGQKSTIQQFTSSLNDSHLKAFQADLENWANSIREEMHLSDAQEKSGARAITREIFKSASSQQKLATKMRVLDFCSTYDHEIAWKQTRKAGNTSFHTKNVEYQEWRDGSHPRTLMYTGKLGSGKSVLLANVVDDLCLSTEKERSMIAYFFCRHDVQESLKARTIIGSLVRQLLCSILDLSVPAKSCENTHTTRDTEKVLEVLFQGFPSNTKAYIVLDGLDECDDEEKHTVVQAVRKVQEKLRVMVCTSFREEPNNGLQSVTKQLLDTRIVLLPADNSDIEAFIEADLERCLRQERLTIGDPALILDIQDALSKGSQGMFLWVALQIQSLCSMKTDHAIREALADLPRDLSETFDRILQKSGSSDPSLQAKTLQLILAAYRPLTTDELREALSVTPGDATWDSSRVLNNVHSALASCGCLLAIDEEELTVRVVHHSVKQYMLSGLDGVKHVSFSLKDARRTFADTVVTYLNYDVFMTELSRVKVHPIMTQSAPSKIVEAAVPSSGIIRDLAMRLLKSRRQPAFDMSKAVAEARSSFQSRPENTFRFYLYARRYWQDHVLYVSGHEDTIFRLSTRLVHGQASGLQKLDTNYCTHIQRAVEYGNANVLGLLFQAGKIDTNARDSDGLTPLMWAASKGHRDTVEVLLSVGKADVDAKDASGSTPLIWAASYGHQDTVEVLLSLGKADVAAKDNDGRTPLMWAARVGHKDIVKLLLSVGKADINAKGDDGWTTLMEAASHGFKDIVEVLLSVGKAHVDAKDSFGRTPMVYAIKYGHKDVVEVLLSVGKARVDTEDNLGWTPMVWAIKYGHKDIVEVLLSVGKADIHAKDNNRWTPLIWAAKDGFKDIVEVLLSVGKPDVDAKDKSGLTPLMLASSGGHKETVKILLSVGKADINAKDNSGLTPLMWGARSGHKDIVEVLLSVGKADVNGKDNDGLTPLMWASSEGHKDIVKVLLIVGRADVNAKDNYGSTSLMRAARSRHEGVVRMLRRYTP